MTARFTRREVLLLGAAGAVAACAPGGSDNAAGPASSSVVGPTEAPPPTSGGTLTAADLPPYEASADFPEGILSGDPAPDSVVLWTRPSADLVATGAEVVAEVSTDVGFATIVASATAAPDPAVEGATKLIIEGLEPATAYAYRFRVGEATSPVGLTRTAPAPGAAVAALTMAVFSCQRWTHGYYTAHADLAEQAPDLVVCLGDYVYETGPADGVTVVGREDPILDAKSVEEFRRKYELYRSDVNLQAVHRVAPIVAIPDNHDGSHTPDSDKYPGAHQAFFEKMPVRQDPNDELRTHRRLTWGSLVDVWMLDLERWRTRAGSRQEVAADPEATYLGDEQRQWLFDGLAETDTTWQVLGSAKQVSPLRLTTDPDGDGPIPAAFANLDQWDGYPAERTRLMDEVTRLGRTGVVAVSGDMHWFWAADVTQDPDDPAAPPVLVDFLCGGISSSNADERIGDGGPQTPLLLESFGPANGAYTRYFDGDRHGYGLFRFTPTEATVEFRSPTTILEPVADTEVVAEFTLDPTRAGIQRTSPDPWPPT